MKRKLFSIISLTLLCILSAAAKVPVPQSQKQRLTDGWSFLRQDIGNIWEAVRPVKSDQPENYPRWQTVTVPHCFNATDCVAPDVNYYQEPGWYKNLLSIDSPYADGRVLLEFEGAGQKTEVYIYDQQVATHVGGYDSWEADITEAVASFLRSPEVKRFGGKVPLSIRCDNSRDAEMIPSDMSDFNVYGGLYRYVNLVYLPKLSVSRLHIEPSLSANRKEGRIAVLASFCNPKDVRRATLSVSIKAPDGRVVATQEMADITPLGETLAMDVAVKNPMLWDVENPQLYTCEVEVKADGEKSMAQERFGFRQFEFIDKGPFHLNGRRLLLRGTHRHEDHAGVAAAMTEEMMRREMLMMKEMGVNFIRLGHYQQSEIILNLCDELGILVWEEIPWCRGGLGGETYREQARRMLTNMIQQHHNHPAVIIWGLGNENDWPGDFPEFDEGKIRAFMSELNDLSHRLDPERKTAIRRCDFCSDIVDVYSPTLWAGWYKGDYKDYVKYSQEAFDKVKHFLHVEWGGDSHPGRYTEGVEPSKKDWSETYLAGLIDWHLKEQENMPWLTGTAYWPFKDFSTPVRPDNPVPYVNQKGVVERDLTPKEAYYIFQSYWTTKPMAHIFGHSQQQRWGSKGEAKQVLVFSNCPEVELLLDGQSIGCRKRDSQDYPAAGLRWDVTFAQGQNRLVAIGYSKGKESARDTMDVEYVTAKWGEEAALAVETQSNADGTMTVVATVVDGKGNRCFDSQRFVRFELAGDGTLLKDQGTAHGSQRVQVADGKAIISVQLNGGSSTVAVKSEGLPTQFARIDKAAAKKRRGTSQGDPQARLDYTPGDAPATISVPLAQSIMARYPDYRTAYWKDYTYVQGYMFEAFDRLAQSLGDEQYTAYIKRYIDHYVDADGNYRGGALTNLDNFMTGSAICTLYARTRDERYRKAALQILEAVAKYPCTDGQFWHGNKSPVMWVDGVFMMQMFLIRCAQHVGQTDYCLDIAVRNILAAARHLQRPDGLLLHAWTTELGKHAWADEAGVSREVWSEGMGWYALVVPELLAVLPKSHERYGEVLDVYQRMAKGLKDCQDRNTGGWFMVVDKGDNPLNFIDPSGTGMFTYSIQRGIDLGLLTAEEYATVARRGYESLKPFVRVNARGLLDVIGACDGVTIKPDFLTYVTLEKIPNAKEAVGGVLWAAVIMELRQTANISEQ